MRFITITTCKSCPLTSSEGRARYECGHADTQGYAILLGEDNTPVGLMAYCPLPERLSKETIADILLPIINTVLESDDDNALKAIRLMNELSGLLLNMDVE